MDFDMFEFDVVGLMDHLLKSPDFLVEHNGSPQDNNATAIKISRPHYPASDFIFCVDLAIITFNGIYHLQFLPGANASEIIAITDLLLSYKP